MTRMRMMTKVRGRGKRTKYNRTSPVTEYLGHNYMIMTALQGAAEEQGSSGEFFGTRCQELSSVPVTCSESPPDGRFRTINGCGNNLDNPQYGEYGTVHYGTAQFSTVQFSLVQYSTAQYSKVQYSKVQYILSPLEHKLSTELTSQGPLTAPC